MSVQDNTPTETFESRHAAYQSDETTAKPLWRLQEGETFVPSVSWYSWEDKPTTFRVTREISDFARETLEDGRAAMASVGAIGADGERYTLYIDNPHVEQNGRDAGTQNGRPLVIDTE